MLYTYTALWIIYISVNWRKQWIPPINKSTNKHLRNPWMSKWIIVIYTCIYMDYNYIIIIFKSEKTVVLIFFFHFLSLGMLHFILLKCSPFVHILWKLYKFLETEDSFIHPPPLSVLREGQNTEMFSFRSILFQTSGMTALLEQKIKSNTESPVQLQGAFWFGDRPFKAVPSTDEEARLLDPHAISH